MFNPLRRRLPESAASDAAYREELGEAARHVADVLGLPLPEVATRLEETLAEVMVTPDEAAAAILDGRLWDERG